MPKYTYIHIPFCSSKCRYCAFTSFINTKGIEKYLNALLSQIEIEYDNTPQKTLYIGGGTPSLLKLKQIKEIIQKFNFENKPEITIEINPENADIDYLKGLLELNINRLSIGIQTFEDDILQNIGRRHSAKDGIKAVQNAVSAGFKNISIDLMYGLPGQTLGGWQKSLEMAISLGVSHISAYGLKIEEKTYFDKFLPRNLPDDELQAKMYKKTLFILKDFCHYEISNFAKNKNFMSKHNLNYWNVVPYNAYGVASCGFDGVFRYKNSENLKKYIENPLLKDEKTLAALLSETIFLGFRKIEGINTKAINKKFNIDFDEKFKNLLKKYIQTGHIIKTDKGYRFSIEGVLISNYILCDFLC